MGNIQNENVAPDSVEADAPAPKRRATCSTGRCNKNRTSNRCYCCNKPLCGKCALKKCPKYLTLWNFSHTHLYYIYLYTETTFFEVLKAIKAKCSLSYSIHICCRCSLVPNKNFYHYSKPYGVRMYFIRQLTGRVFLGKSWFWPF